MPEVYECCDPSSVDRFQASSARFRRGLKPSWNGSARVFATQLCPNAARTRKFRSSASVPDSCRQEPPKPVRVRPATEVVRLGQANEFIQTSEPRADVTGRRAECCHFQSPFGAKIRVPPLTDVRNRPGESRACAFEVPV